MWGVWHSSRHRKTLVAGKLCILTPLSLCDR
jgi:hypothetical protein